LREEIIGFTLREQLPSMFVGKRRYGWKRAV
jgi:hypothetical protein